MTRCNVKSIGHRNPLVLFHPSKFTRNCWLFMPIRWCVKVRQKLWFVAMQGDGDVVRGWLGVKCATLLSFIDSLSKLISFQNYTSEKCILLITTRFLDRKSRTTIKLVEFINKSIFPLSPSLTPLRADSFIHVSLSFYKFKTFVNKVNCNNLKTQREEKNWFDHSLTFSYRRRYPNKITIPHRIVPKNL